MIRLLVLDVDGVLTDGGLYYGPDGERLKRFDVHDGLGIKLLQAAGVTVALVSGRESPALRRRATDLGIEQVHLGAADKGPAIEAIQHALAIGVAETAAMGDDLPDLAMFERAALKLAPADAEPELRAAADHVAPRGGGRGAVRDAARYILMLNGSSGEDTAVRTLHG